MRFLLLELVGPLFLDQRFGQLLAELLQLVGDGRGFVFGVRGRDERVRLEVLLSPKDAVEPDRQASGDFEACEGFLMVAGETVDGVVSRPAQHVEKPDDVRVDCLRLEAPDIGVEVVYPRNIQACGNVFYQELGESAEFDKADVRIGREVRFGTLGQRRELRVMRCEEAKVSAGLIRHLCPPFPAGDVIDSGTRHQVLREPKSSSYRVAVTKTVTGGILRFPTPSGRGDAVSIAMMADGLTQAEILDAYPDLAAEDLAAALSFAAQALHERELPLRPAS